MKRKTTRHYVHLSDDEKEYIRDNAIQTDKALANYIGCDEATVSRHRKRLGVPTCTTLRQQFYAEIARIWRQITPSERRVLCSIRGVPYSAARKGVWEVMTKRV